MNPTYTNSPPPNPLDTGTTAATGGDLIGAGFVFLLLVFAGLASLRAVAQHKSLKGVR